MRLQRNFCSCRHDQAEARLTDAQEQIKDLKQELAHCEQELRLHRSIRDKNCPSSIESRSGYSLVELFTWEGFGLKRQCLVQLEQAHHYVKVTDPGICIIKIEVPVRTCCSSMTHRLRRCWQMPDSKRPGMSWQH